MANILFVNESGDDAQSLKSILDKLGHELRTVNSGSETVESADMENVDLLMLDADLSSVQGLDAVSLLKSNEKTKRIPLVLIAGKPTVNGELAKALEAGVDEFISKPFGEAEVTVRIRSMLRIKNLNSHMNMAHKILEEEMEMAQKVQSSLLPTRFPYPDRLRFHARYRTTSSIGGDFYDVLDLGDGKIGMIMADVSGHGPSAALIVSMIKTIVCGNTDRTASPAQLVKNLNEQLLKIIPEERFVSLFCATLDLDKNLMTYVRCGHPYPFIMRKSDRSFEKLKAPGEFVGLYEDLQVEQAQVQLRKGDRLLTYSDGLIEVCNADGRPFGFKRLVQTLERGFDQGGDELLTGLLDETSSFDCASCAADDVAILLMEVI